MILETYVCLSHAWAAVEQEDLAFAFVIDEVSFPDICVVLITVLVVCLGIRVFVNESLDHFLFVFMHHQFVDSVPVGSGLLAAFRIKHH